MKRIIPKKTLFLFALVALATLYSCKKEKVEETKANPEQIVKSPEKFGYKLVTDQTPGLTATEKQELSLTNFTAYYNSAENSTLLVSNSIIGNPNSGQGPTYEFNSSESILSGQMEAEAPGIIDDSGSLLDLGLICVNECAWVLYYGSITGSVNGKIWLGSDFGSFKLKSDDDNYWMRKYMVDRAIDVDPVGWIVETDRY